MGSRLSIDKRIRQQGEDIIEETEGIIDRLHKLEVYAKEKRRPYMHFYTFQNDLKLFINHFQRLMR